MSEQVGTPTTATATEADIEEIRARYVSSVAQFLNEKPEEFKTIICHAVLGRPLSDSTSEEDRRLPFSVEEENEVEARAATRYAYIADLLLRQQKGQVQLPDDEFIRIAQFIEDNVNLDRWLGRVAFNSMRAMDIWHEYFDEFEGSLSYSVALATHFIHQGVPAYQLNAVEKKFERLSSNDPLYHYLRIRGEAFDVVNDLNLPGWANTLYFKQEDLRWHQVFFASYEKPNVAKEQELRAALLKHLGMAPAEADPLAGTGSHGTAWPWGTHETTLLRHLAAAAKRFWVNYDPSDIGTAPTNSAVVDWLREQGVAQRTAEVVATILRADGLPTGPRP